MIPTFLSFFLFWYGYVLTLRLCLFFSALFSFFFIFPFLFTLPSFVFFTLPSLFTLPPLSIFGLGWWEDYGVWEFVTMSYCVALFFSISIGFWSFLFFFFKDTSLWPQPRLVCFLFYVFHVFFLCFPFLFSIPPCGWWVEPAMYSSLFYGERRTQSRSGASRVNKPMKSRNYGGSLEIQSNQALFDTHK